MSRLRFPLLHLLAATGLLIALNTYAQGTGAPAEPNRNAVVNEAPDALIKRVSMDVLNIARNDPQIQAGDRQRIFKLVEDKILPYLDFQRATSLTAGAAWRTATPDQRQRLSDEFRNLLLYTYGGAMSQAGDQKLEFLPLRSDASDNDTEVRSLLTLPRGGEPVAVNYRLWKTPTGWKIYDVSVFGAWLTQTYKSSFSTEINKGGIDGLIATLAEKNRSLAARDAATAK